MAKDRFIIILLILLYVFDFFVLANIILISYLLDKLITLFVNK